MSARYLVLILQLTLTFVFSLGERSVFAQKAEKKHLENLLETRLRLLLKSLYEGESNLISWNPESKILSFFRKDGHLQREMNLNEIDISKKNIPLPVIDSNAKPLEGIRIGIDPGHIGGHVMKLVEQRYIDMMPEKVGNRLDIRFHEGELTFWTAQSLMEKLEDLGAKVTLTRSKNASALVFSFEEFLNDGEDRYIPRLQSWLKSKELDSSLESPSFLWGWGQRDKALEAIAQIKAGQELDKGQRSALWFAFSKLYDPMDLEKRAHVLTGQGEKKNHLALIIHYNAAAGYDKETLKHLGSHKNYCMTFIPGSFCENELKSKEDWAHFTRLLTSDQIQESEALSSAITKQFSDPTGMNVPTASIQDPSDNFDYLKKYCVPTSHEGVFARNLALTRLVEVPLCYGEALCQDNFEECIRLTDQREQRLQQVVDAYVNGVVQYVAERRNRERQREDH